MARLSPALALVLAGALASCGGEDDGLPPNVVLISLDTLRYDHCGFNGYERDTTPFLDRLALESIAFDRAYTTMSWTLVAHMSMLTGLFPTQHGVVNRNVGLTTELPTLAERLRREGYTTLGVFHRGWLDPRYGFGRGFDVYTEANDAEAAGVALADALGRVREGIPYFAFIHLFDIHSSDFSDPDASVYDPPAPYDSIFVEDARARLKGIDPKALWDEPGPASAETTEAVVALYDGGIRYVDSVLEAWFTDWGERGLLENTLVIVTSDHGEGLRQRLPRFSGHGGMNEEGLRIPLLVRLPDGARGGERDASLVSLVDVVPTVVDAVGLRGDDRLPGSSLLRPERGDDDWVFAGNDRLHAAVSTTRKIVYNDEGPAVLYRLDEDPLERAPLRRRDEPQAFEETAVPLFDAAMAALAALHPPLPPRDIGKMDRATADRLEALGYGGEVGR